MQKRGFTNPTISLLTQNPNLVLALWQMLLMAAALHFSNYKDKETLINYGSVR